MPAAAKPSDGPTAVVTGASSGIGLELARILADRGYRLVVVARSAERLAPVVAELRGRGASATPVALDLAAPGAPEALYRQAPGPIDLLVNNAGFGTFGPFVATETHETLSLIGVNVVALTHLTRLYLPGMVERGRGRVLNVASAAAFQPGPLMAVYYATKAYVLHLSEALADELRETGVTVTALCPGPVRTGFHARAVMEDSGLVRRRKPMSARTVARVGYAGLVRGKRIVIPGVANRLLALCVRLVPRRVATLAVRKLQERRPSNGQRGSGRISNRTSSGSER